MYVGRIVAAGMNKAGDPVGMYRVSSRSFPNRETRMNGETVAVMPRAGFEDDLSKNPYIAYNCIRIAGNTAIVSNGSHTDPITEKIAMGMPPRDALALGLLAMDYEKDSLNTPRIVATVTRGDNRAYLGIIRHDGISVKEFELTPGIAFYIATYEHNVPCSHYCDKDFDVESPEAACSYIIRGGVFANLEKPVTAAAVVAGQDGFYLATETV